ncbi:MAG: STAS domain-containing protein [Melioribacter sp.]|uniref:STAS domain-containing protein n=1 Tax=Melioribacter sp. TaxID=2052167 RepID=UPI003BD55AA1
MAKIPILKLGSTLLVSIQTELHDRLASELQEEILASIEKNKSKAVIIDITALEIVDSFIGRMLTNTAEMASLMDAEVILVGISPAVAITLVELGMELKGVKTALDLESALEIINDNLSEENNADFFSSDPKSDDERDEN